MVRKFKQLPFDRIYNPSAEAETVVLYADIQTEIFKDFHSILKKLADEGVEPNRNLQDNLARRLVFGLVSVLQEDFHGRLANERLSAREQLIEHDSH